MRNRAKITLFIFVAAVLLAFEMRAAIGFDLPKWFPFSTNHSLSEWENKILRGKVIYKIEHTGTEGYLHALSIGAASAIFYKVRNRFRIEEFPMLSWKWKVARFPDKEKLRIRQGIEKDDYAARVYVIFPSLIFLNSKALEYVWDETAPLDAVCTSPYSKNIKLIVVESGRNASGGWVSEERNIFKDYLWAFGRNPTLRVGAIALMSDADNTSEVSEAYFDEIRIGYKEKR